MRTKILKANPRFHLQGTVTDIAQAFKLLKFFHFLYARSENAEQNTQEPTATTNETIIRRRQKKMNRPFYYLGGNNGTNMYK